MEANLDGYFNKTIAAAFPNLDELYLKMISSFRFRASEAI